MTPVAPKALRRAPDDGSNNLQDDVEENSFSYLVDDRPQMISEKLTLRACERDETRKVSHSFVKTILPFAFLRW